LEHIKNIEIKNFKSVRHQKIEDCRRVNVFIGYPNVGKSNILEALSLFSIDQNTNFSSLIRLENFTTLFYNGNIEEAASIFINDKFEYDARFINGKVGLTYKLSTGKKEIGDSIIRGFELTDNGIVAFSQGPSYNRLNSILIRKYEFLKSVQANQGNFSSLNHPFGANIFNVISSNEQLRKEVSELFKEYDLKFSFDKSARAFKILKTVGEDIFLIPYSMIADTLQRLIFYKAAIVSNKDTVLLFEEPEAHMFPPYISKFTSEVIYSENGNQFFINTHSPFVVNDFMENLKKDELSIYAVGYKKETGETITRRLSDKEMHEIYQYGTDLFLNLENYLYHEQ
jgi:AAA15 family ATPase/GTPase